MYLQVIAISAYLKSYLCDGDRLGGGASAALPLLNVRGRPTHTNAVAAVGATDTAVVPGAGPIVALG